jgi:Zn-dependent peptidase ImmA (M78 family)/DNA-binding XRE family transcriptional regulator
MTVGVQTFSGERLKEARLARGLTKKSLADMIGISGTAITRYEDGIDKPQREKLSALADKLSFPPEFFVNAEWPEALDLVFWRSRSSETKSAREMTEQRMKWLCELFAFLEDDVDFPKMDLPDIEVPEDFRLITPEVIERVAEEVRSYWGFRNQPIPDIALALENSGIPVVNLTIESDKQDGFCFFSNKLGRSFVGINVYNVSACRARFDACHELGHILLHRRVTPQQARDVVFHKIIEQQAHRFAGALLFPRKSFLAEVGMPSLDYFCALKKRWGISIAAMIFRARNLDLIDDYEKAALYQNMTRRRWRGPLREPFDDPSEMPVERPRMLRRGVEAILDGNVLSRSVMKSALGLPQREIEQIAGLPDGYLNESSIIELAILKRDRSLKAVDLESGNVLEFPRRKG